MLAPVLVLDLELTTADDGSIPPEYMEVLEVGAVWVMPDGQILDRFHAFVRPTAPQLTAYCLALLPHINQAIIDAAPCWPTVACALAEFVQRHYQPGSWWGSWGVSDYRQVQQESARHGTVDPLAGLPHENLKRNFSKARKPKIKQCGMIVAMKICNLTPRGPHHHALADALNVARLLPFCPRQTPAAVGQAVVAQAAGHELVAALPDGRQLRHTDADELAKLLLAEGVKADDVRMPDWSEGDCAPTTGQKLAIWNRMRATRQR